MFLDRDNRDILEFVILGDSLSDRGMLWNRKLFGIFPMADWSGLKGNSPDKRFTNGPVWADDFALLLFLKFNLKDMVDEGCSENPLFKKLAKFYEQYLKNPEQLYSNPELLSFYKDNMENSEFIKWKGYVYLRSFAEGGVADDPALLSLFTAHGKAFFARFAVSRLRTMRKLLIADDKAKGKQQSEKIKSLIMEWTGANDLITINDNPTKEAAKLAVHERIENVKKLIKHGYQNFLLFDLPDLSLTPRFCEENNRNDPEKTANVRMCCSYFNALLIMEIEKLREQYPQCDIKMFEVSKRFERIYYNPKKYGLKEMLRAKPLITSDNYQKPNQDDKAVPFSGHMFYDTVHPSDHVHYLLSRKVEKYINKQYKVTDPAKMSVQQDFRKLEIEDDVLIKAFMKKYRDTFFKD